MNRIELPAHGVSLSLSVPSYSPTSPNKPYSLDRGLRPQGRGDQFINPHATFTPIHYEPGYAYPLIVWLHGAGDNERQLSRVLPLVSMRNYVAVGPRGTSVDRARRGAFRWRQTLDDIELAEARVEKSVELAKSRFHINPQRVFLAGYGCGGTMAVRVAWNNPSRYAGAATIGGSLPSEAQPLRHVNAMRQMPCFLAAARRSCAYPEPAVCSDLRLLHAVGCDVDLRQYPCGDELTTNMLSDLDCWAMGVIGGIRS
jgi:phospholipase/carboxylesterase